MYVGNLVLFIFLLFLYSVLLILLLIFIIFFLLLIFILVCSLFSGSLSIDLDCLFVNFFHF